MSANRGALWQARIVALSVFGPYVTGAARTEQIVVFALALWVLVTGAPRMMDAQAGPLPFLAVWGALLAVIVISTRYRPFDPMYYGSQPPSHIYAAFAIPVAMMVLTWWWSLQAGPVAVLRAAAPVVVAGMCVNTVIEFWQMSAGNAALGILPSFWDASQTTAGSVAARAAGNLRYTGIFDQPAEAGIAYGAALLLLIWLARQSLRPSLVTAGVVLLTAGGVLTLSKVFLLAGLPVAVVTVLRGRARVRTVVTAAVCAGLLWCAGAAGLLPAWQAGSAEAAQFASPQSITATYTAGRYGTGGTLAPEFTDVLHTAPVTGFGAGGLNAVAYDSLWQETFVVSGAAGVVLTVAVLAMAAWRLAAWRPRMRRAEWQLACGALVLAAGASAGIPSLTANRAGTVLWLILGTLLTARSGDAAGGQFAGAASSRGQPIWYAASSTPADPP